MKLEVTSIADATTVSSKEFLAFQTIAEWRFTLNIYLTWEKDTASFFPGKLRYYKKLHKLPLRATNNNIDFLHK